MHFRDIFGLWATPETRKGPRTLIIRVQLARSPDKPISVDDERTIDACRNLLHLQLCDESIEFKKSNDDLTRNKVISEMVSDLADTEIEKFKALVCHGGAC